MSSCRTLTKEMLAHAVKIHMDREELNFQTARQAALQKAGEMITAPTLMAWYDKKTGQYSPKVECCGEEKPSWMIYAESRGGHTIIDINDGEYVFMFAKFEGYM